MPSSTAERIDLYAFDLEPGPAAIKRLARVLSSDEQARAARRVNQDDGDRFRVAHGVLRHVLASHTNHAPHNLTFATGAHGKPFLAAVEAPIFFNLSHSGSLGVIAITTHDDIGVDVEVWRDVAPGLAERFFSDAEVSALNELADDHRRAAFFRCWTRKEAVIKALGDGFSRPLKSFDVSIDDVEHPTVERLDDPGTQPRWRLRNFTPQPGASGAIAYRAMSPLDCVRHDVDY